MDDLIRYELQDGIATVTMDDGKANVMSVRMLNALNAALDQALADKAVLVLTGRERMFSGGFDLAVFQRDKQELLAMLMAGARLTERLLAHPLPVVAACSGHAVAMGVFLMLCADVRIGIDDGARTQINEVQNGMTLPRFAIEVSRHRLAPEHLNRALLLATPYAPQQALAAGFYDMLVAPAALAEAARAEATRLRKLHAGAFAASKLRLHQQVLTALREGIAQDLADWTAMGVTPA